MATRALCKAIVPDLVQIEGARLAPSPSGHSLRGPGEQMEALARAVTALEQITYKSPTSVVVAQGARRLLMVVADWNGVVEETVADVLEIAYAECMAAIRAENVPEMRQLVAQDKHQENWVGYENVAKEEFMTWLIDCVQRVPTKSLADIPTINITPPALNLVDVPTDNLLEHAFEHARHCRLNGGREPDNLVSTSSSPKLLSQISIANSKQRSLSSQPRLAQQCGINERIEKRNVESTNARCLALSHVPSGGSLCSRGFRSRLLRPSPSLCPGASRKTTNTCDPIRLGEAPHKQLTPSHSFAEKALGPKLIEFNVLDAWEADFLARCAVESTTQCAEKLIGSILSAKNLR